jgi:hypothetical protein
MRRPSSSTSRSSTSVVRLSRPSPRYSATSGNRPSSRAAVVRRNADALVRPRKSVQNEQLVGGKLGERHHHSLITDVLVTSSRASVRPLSHDSNLRHKPPPWPRRGRLVLAATTVAHEYRQARSQRARVVDRCQAQSPSQSPSLSSSIAVECRRLDRPSAVSHVAAAGGVGGFRAGQALHDLLGVDGGHGVVGAADDGAKGPVALGVLHQLPARR